MNRYVLTIYQPDGGHPEPEALAEVMRNVAALVQETKDKGVWVFNGGLHDPDAATVLRFANGEVLTTDGPYTEGKEHVGGFLIIQVADHDAALEWARRMARVITLPIELRLFRGESGD